MDTQNISTHPSQARVLVVDDHPSTAITLARAISQLGPGVEVISATSGKMALEYVKDEAVDFLITDMMMPDMNGLELIETLRAHPGGRPTYTVLITAYDVPGVKESARRLKVDEVLIKPIRPERIRQIVGKTLEEMGCMGIARPAAEALPAHKILIADDSPDNVSLLSRYLQSEGYRLVTASNGVDALEKTRSEMPDLVLLDVNMPEMDGFAVLQEIRADPATEHIPVIILTAARPDPIDVQAGLNLGADDYVTKPFDRRELLARLRAKLRVKDAGDALRRRNRELNALTRIAKVLAAPPNLEELLDAVLQIAVQALGASAGQVILLEKPNNPLVSRSAPEAGVPFEASFPQWKQAFRQMGETQQGWIIDDTQRDPRWQAAPSKSARSAILVPLLGRLGPSGLMMLLHERAGYFKPEQLPLMQAIASQVALAVENAHLRAGTVSQRQESSPSEAALRNMADAVLMFDGAGCLVWSNPAAEDLFKEGRIAVGQHLSPGKGYEALIAAVEEVLASGEPRAVEISWPDRRIFLVQCTPVERSGCMAVLHDITHFKEWNKKRTSSFPPPCTI